MVNGKLPARGGARDLGLQHGDARVELVHGKRVEVLPGQQGQRIVGSPGEKIVEIHARDVDLCERRLSISRTGEGDGGMAIPASMKAIEVAAPGGADALRLSDMPVPAPGEGEVLIRVAAAGVNRPDVLQRMGAYPPPPGASPILGLEVAGEIVAVGAGVMREQLGQKVCALVPGGGYAGYCTTPAVTCLPVPPALSMIEAAAIPETLFTVWINLFERAYATEGDTVLVHGGTSGIGTMAIALGRLFGLTVIVTCGSPQKCAAATALGAAHAIDYSAQDFVAEIGRITDGRGVSAVLDMVGGDYVARNIACLAEEGRHVSIAFQRGAMAEVNIMDVMRRRLTLTGSTLRPRSAAFKGLVADELHRTVWPHVAEGRLKPVIDRTFPLAEAGEAHRRMEAGEHVGKIVLVM